MGLKNSEDKTPNELIDSASPYLRQHAFNPINWTTWSDAALEKATAENKLLFISIGYSACHWCHVMEHESFGDEEVAHLLNSHFVSIKIDREERPDLDSIYMEAVQMLTGTAGWPLTCIALPDGRPVFGGTYIPKPKLLARLTELIDVKETQFHRLTDFAEKVTSGVDHQISNSTTNSNTELSTLVESWKEIWDRKNGQFLGAPKFAIPTNLNFLLDYGSLCTDDESSAHAYLTLDKMAKGGLFDHIRGGFYRYSVDEEWNIPHFEKMLYDTAQLIGTYSKAYQLNPKQSYKYIVYNCFEFLNSEMLSENGCFYSALDADSDGEEGKFYAFNESDLAQTLSTSEIDLLLKFYSLQTGYFTKNESNIEATEQVDKILHKIKTSQSLRNRPGLDDKILTSWNALLISGFCSAYETFNDISFIQKAKKSLDYMLLNSIDDKGVLCRAFHSKKGNYIDGFLDDYAYTIEACINMYNCTLEMRYLSEARNLLFTALDLFYDSGIKGFWYTASTSTKLFSKKQEKVDSVLPSASSVMASNLLSLGRHFSRTDWITMAEKMTSSALGSTSHLSNSTNWATVRLQLTLPHYKFSLSGTDCSKIAAAHRELLSKRPLHSSLAGPNHPSVTPSPLDLSIIACTNDACLLPVTSVTEALDQIR